MPDPTLKCGAGLQGTFGPESWSAEQLHLEPCSKDVRQHREGQVAARREPLGWLLEPDVCLSGRKKVVLPLWACVLEELPYKPLVQSRVWDFLYSLLGLYFQDFSGKIKPLKNILCGPSWDDCMMNVSCKARLMLLWHLWEKLLLVSIPTLLLVHCLMPKPNSWFSRLLSEFSVGWSLLQK